MVHPARFGRDADDVLAEIDKRPDFELMAVGLHGIRLYGGFGESRSQELGVRTQRGEGGGVERLQEGERRRVTKDKVHPSTGFTFLTSISVAPRSRNSLAEAPAAL